MKGVGGVGTYSGSYGLIEGFEGLFSIFYGVVSGLPVFTWMLFLYYLESPLETATGD